MVSPAVNNAPRCPSCRTQVEPDAATCRNCGAALGAAATVIDEDEAPTQQISPDDKTAVELHRTLSPRIEVLRRLGGGGMSTVYLGRDPALHRLVAIKVLSDNLNSDPLARARFTREAEAAAAIVHPHVIEIHEVGTLPRSKKPYIVMQFVDGLTLQQEILTGAAVPEAVGKAVVGEISSALAAAHARGVIHRDIKPSNIVIDRETGHAVVLDFGIAAAVDQNALVNREKLTLQGIALGTPAYMSPEQLREKKTLSGKSDVYSLGVVAFEYVTGRPPFIAEAPEEYIAAHLQDTPPDVRSLRPDLDGPFADLINRCLVKNPNLRPSADDIARAIQPPLRVPVVWPPPGLGLLRGAAWKQITGLAATAAAGIAFFLTLSMVPWTTARGGAPNSLSLALLAGTASAAVLLGTLSLIRGVRASLLLRAGHAARYPWSVLLDVALDGRDDTAALVNGFGPFALIADATRKKLLRLRRLRAGSFVVATAVGMLGPVVWAVFGSGSVTSQPTQSLSSSEMALLFGLPAMTVIAGLLLGMPEWLVRNPGRRPRGLLPLPWTLRPTRTELVERWLTEQGRTPAAESARPVARVVPFLSVAVGSLMTLLLVGTLALTLAAVRTSNQWSARANVVADAVLADTARSWNGRMRLVQAAGRLPGRSSRPRLQWAGSLAEWLLVDTSDSSSQGEGGEDNQGSSTDDGPPRHTSLSQLWRTLPKRLPRETYSALTEDTLVRALRLWRRVAYSRPLPGLWMYTGDLDEFTAPDVDLPLFRAQDVLELAAKNEAGALLHIAAGQKNAAVGRARENIAVGGHLLRDPIHGWLGADVVSDGADILHGVGLLTGDRQLLMEAERLSATIGSDDVTRRGPWFGAALMADPREPVGIEIVADSARPEYVRWWSIAGVVPGFCGSAREILFGVNPERRAVLDRAATLVEDTPRSNEWVAMNQRWLDAWVSSGPTTRQQLPRWLVPLPWIGLRRVADRIAYCRLATERF